MKTNNISYYVKTSAKLIVFFYLCAFFICAKPCLAQHYDSEIRFRIIDVSLSSPIPLTEVFSILFRDQGIFISYENSIYDKIKNSHFTFEAKSATAPEIICWLLKENNLNYKYLGNRQIKIIKADDNPNVDISLLEKIMVDASREVEAQHLSQKSNINKSESFNNAYSSEEIVEQPPRTPVKIFLSTEKNNYKIGDEVNVSILFVLLESLSTSVEEQTIKQGTFKLWFNKKVLKIVNPSIKDKYGLNASRESQNLYQEILIEIPFGSKPKTIGHDIAKFAELKFQAIGSGDANLRLSLAALYNGKHSIAPIMLRNTPIIVELAEEK